MYEDCLAWTTGPVVARHAGSQRRAKAYACAKLVICLTGVDALPEAGRRCILQGREENSRMFGLISPKRHPRTSEIKAAH